MRRLAILTGTALLLLTAASHAQDSGIKAIDTVLVQGKASVGTKAPPDWIPVRNPKNLGLCVAYVLKGHNFDDSPSVIYPRLVSGRTIEQLVQASADHLKRSSPSFRLEKKKDFRSKKDVSFAVRYFLNGPAPNRFEAVGYLAYKGQLLIVVYSNLSRKDFDKNIGAFYAALDRVAPYSSEINALSGSCLIPKN